MIGVVPPVNPDPFSADEDLPDLSTLEGLIEELEAQAGLLISVATGGPRIDDVNDDYKERRQRLKPVLTRRGLSYPFPWPDLWQWYGYWSANLGGYAARRTHIRSLITPTLEDLERQRSTLSITDPKMSGPSSWADLDGRVAGLALEMSEAQTRDDLQDVGRRAREILIDCAEVLADPSLVPEGTDPPKAGDAKQWLDLFLQEHGGGSGRDALRRLVRDAWDVAQKVTHGDNVDHVDAFAAAQATVLVVRTLQELASPRL
jgi:hypothetical protein